MLFEIFGQRYRDEAGESDAGGAEAEAVVDPVAEQTARDEAAVASADEALKILSEGVPAETQDATEQAESAETEQEETASADEQIPAEDDTGAETSAADAAAIHGETEQVQYSDDLLKRAHQFGISQATVERLGTPQALEAAIEHAQLVVNVLANRSDSPAPQVQQQAAVPQVSHEEAVKKLVEEGFDEGLAERIVATDEKAAHAQAETEALKQQMAQMQGLQAQQAQFAQQQQQEAYRQQQVRQFDDAIAKLPEHFTSLIGKGPSGELKDQKLVQIRANLWSIADGIQRTYQEQGMTPPPYERVVEEAAYGKFGRQIEQLIRTNLQQKIAKSSSQHLQRPTSASTKNLPPDESAVRFLDEGFKALQAAGGA